MDDLMLDLLFDPDEISPWSLLWPSCLLCGAVIRPAHCSVSSTAYQRTVGRQLHQKNDQEHKQVVISAKKVEEEYLSDCPSLGASTFRAIMIDVDGQFHLTGICIAGWSCNDMRNFAVLPRDMSIARIGASSPDFSFHPAPCEPGFTRFRPLGVKDAPPKQPPSSPTGYLLHAHCWMLLGRVCERKKATLELLDLGRVVRAATALRTTEPNAWYMAGGYGHGNPLVIPRIRSAISLAERTVTRTRCAKSSALKAIQSTLSMESSHPMNTLPLDIAVMIAELLCPVVYHEYQAATLRDFLSIFQWTLPECFWRSRVDEGLFFELEDLRKSDINTSIDWQALRLELMQIYGYRLRYRTGWAIRIQVLGTLIKLLAAYLEDKEEQAPGHKLLL